MTVDEYKKSCHLATLYYKYEIQDEIWKMHDELYMKWRVISKLRQFSKGTASFYEYDRDYTKYYYMLDAYIDIIHYLMHKKPW